MFLHLLNGEVAKVPVSLMLNQSCNDKFIEMVEEDSKGNTIIEGKLHKNIRRAGSSGQYSIYYNIDTYITWKNNKFFFISEVLDTLRFNTYQIKFHIQ